ncbi:MAG: GH3 auxin-responsive promoter family protein [Bdellovibrionales bacterium]|nr:GH3 auxin-responsive promoter family protein [Bdellovibrionales bacterium]
MSLLSKLIYAMTYGPYQSFVRDCQNPQQAQERVWQETVAEISRSPFWKDSFRKQVALNDFPVSEYEFYRLALEDSYKSKTSSLSGQPVFFWAESSGTSGHPKLFPITKLYQKQFQRTVKPLVHSYLQRFPGFLEKPVLYFAATNSKRVSPAGVESGYISNFNYRNISPLLRTSYAFPYEIFSDASVFDQWSQVYALASDLSAMISVTPSQIELFAKNILKFRDENWPYLTGAKAIPGNLPKIKVSSERLAVLEKAFSNSFAFENFWPSLNFICSWQSSACGLQAKNLQSFIKTNHLRQIDATYSASEGWANVPIKNTVGGPFIPARTYSSFQSLATLQDY